MCCCKMIEDKQKCSKQDYDDNDDDYDGNDQNDEDEKEKEEDGEVKAETEEEEPNVIWYDWFETAFGNKLHERMRQSENKIYYYLLYTFFKRGEF